jgi:hypothetical protein
LARALRLELRGGDVAVLLLAKIFFLNHGLEALEALDKCNSQSVFEATVFQNVIHFLFHFSSSERREILDKLGL